MGSRGQEDPDVRQERELVLSRKAQNSPLVIADIGKTFSGVNGYVLVFNFNDVNSGQDKHALSHLTFHVEVKIVVVDILICRKESVLVFLDPMVQERR